MIAIKTETRPRVNPIIILDLSTFVILGLGFTVIVTPLMRGLFFPEEYVLAQMFMGFLWLLFALDCLIKRQTILRITLPDILACGFALAYFFSLLNAVHIKEAVFGAFRAFNYVLLYYMAAHYSREERTRNKLLAFIFFSTVVVSAIGLAAAAGIVDFPGAYGGKRIMSVFQYGNALGIFSAAGLLLGLGFLQTARNPLFKALVAIGLFLNLTAMLGSQSRGTWLVFGLMLFFYLLATRKQDFWNAFYQLFTVGLFGLVGSKGFLQGVYGENTATALKWLVLGAVLVGTGILIIHYIPSLVERNRKLKRYKTVLLWVLALTLAVCAVTYFSYTAKVLPSPAGQLVATEVLHRVGDISGQESSYQDRLKMYGWAVEIIKQHPLLGVGAGGWNALYHLYQDKIYWSREVHNHFLQVGVETGLIGLFFYLAFTLTLIWRFGRMLFYREENPRWPLAWSVFLAYLALFLHSGVDFELSFPAFSMVFWSLAAFVHNEAGRGPTKKGMGEKQITLPPLAYLLVALIISTVLFYPAQREYRAGVLGAQAAQAMLDLKYPEALAKMEQAFMLSPLSANFAADLAQLHASRHEALGEDQDREKAYSYINKAVTLEPFNIRNMEAINRAHVLLGDHVAVLADLEQMAAMLPLNVAAQEQLAGSFLIHGMNYLEQKEMLLAEIFLEKVLEITQSVEEKYRASGEIHNMRPTPGIYLAAGQAALLLKDDKTAVEKLETAFRYGQTKETAGLWLAMAYRDKDRLQHDKYYKQYVQNDSRHIAIYETILKWLDTNY